MNDDYVKFIRFAQWRIERSQSGVIAFITNHGFLDNPTFRGMRNALLKSFDEIYVFDLHGNSKKKNTSPDGTKDENVFDIQQGVCISFFVRNDRKRAEDDLAEVYRADLFGTREKKYSWLSAHSMTTTDFTKIAPAPPFYIFAKQNDRLREEYQRGISLADLFKTHNTGFFTACDSLSIAFSKDDMWTRIREFVRVSPAEAKEKWQLGGNRDWQVDWAQEDVKSTGPKRELLMKVHYRPFDLRWCYYTGKMKGFMCNPRDSIMSHVRNGNNHTICVGRAGSVSSSKDWTLCFATNGLVDLNLFRRGGARLFPLSIVKDSGKTESNFLFEQTGLSRKKWSDEDVFLYIYGVLNSPSFRGRYREFLDTDYPRIQFTNDESLFRKICKLGGELFRIHLMDDDRLEGGEVIFGQKGSNTVERIRFDESSGWLWINSKQYFENIDSTTWDYTVGDYKVLEKWLKDRKGRTLSHDEIIVFERICEAVRRSKEIELKLDTVISEAGGWPMEGKSSKQKAA